MKKNNLFDADKLAKLLEDADPGRGGKSKEKPDGKWGKAPGGDEGEGDGEGEGEGEGQPGEGEGEGGDTPTDERSWAEMVEEEFPEGKRLEENLEKMMDLLKRFFEKLAEDRDAKGVQSIMFLMELAVETLKQDFYDGAYVDVPEVLEEDVLRLRRVVREMAGEFTR